MSKAQRQHRISSLLEEHAVTSQAQLTELLEAGGIGATQATVSRDLDEPGAIKVRVPGGETVYAIPEHPVDRIAPEDHLRRVMSDWVADVNHSHMVDQGPVKFWPWTSTVTSGQGATCPAPNQGGQCKDCRACWDRSTANVCYGKH